MSFLSHLTVEQLLILRGDVERELVQRATPYQLSVLVGRAGRFGIPRYGIQDDITLSQSLSSSRKKSAQYSDDTRIIKRNREQREEFIRELDEELDAYAAERDAILAKREAKRGKKYDWSVVLEASE